MHIQIVPFTGEKIKSLIPKIAELRIEVFLEYPFLYVGDYEYEKRYLEKYMTMKDALVVVAFDGDSVIGIANGYPFTYEQEQFQQLFLSHQRNPKDYFCFGESVLKKSYRGLGIGKKFFEYREAHVRSLNRYPLICFYTILRDPEDPRRPSNYRPLKSFWESRGYVEHPELIETLSYQEIGESAESPKKFIFWIKSLETVTSS